MLDVTQSQLDDILVADPGAGVDSTGVPNAGIPGQPISFPSDVGLDLGQGLRARFNVASNVPLGAGLAASGVLTDEEGAWLDSRG